MPKSEDAISEAIAEALLDKSSYPSVADARESFTNWIGFMFDGKPNPSKNAKMAAPSRRAPVWDGDPHWIGPILYQHGRIIGTVDNQDGKWYAWTPRGEGPFNRVRQARLAVTTQIFGLSKDFEVRVRTLSVKPK
jgi:hypothetical protein